MFHGALVSFAERRKIIMELVDFSIEVSENKVKEFADYLYDRENANATVDKYVADIKNSFPFYQIKGLLTKNYCWNIKNGLFRNMQ